jgi:hypothetical protein
VAIRFGPLGFAANYNDDVTITLVGAQATAQAGNVVVDIPGTALGRVSPLGLHQAGYGNFSKVGNVTVTLVGAEVRAQAEQLEGATVTIRLSGATVFTDSEDPIFAEDHGTIIENPNAEVDGFGKYEIDDRTGFRLRPGEQVKEWTGFSVRPKSRDDRNLQEFRLGTDKKLSAAKRPEGEDQFISSSVSAEDL